MIKLNKLNNYFSHKELNKLPFKKIGTNILISKNIKIFGYENIELGNNIRIDDYSIIIATGPLKIKDNCHISSYCMLASRNGIYLGNNVGLSPRVTIFTQVDDYSGNFQTPSIMLKDVINPKNSGKVIIEDKVILGINSTVFPNVIIGEGASVGIGCFVKKNLLPWTMYYSNNSIKLKILKKRIKF